MDDQSDPAVSKQKMTDQVDSAAIAVLGPTFSNSAAEADPVANDAGMTVLAVSNTGPGIVGDCPYPCEYVFRDSLGEEDAIPANIDTLVAAEKPKTAAIVHPPTTLSGRAPRRSPRTPSRRRESRSTPWPAAPPASCWR